jgi:hypothetical protein
MRVVSTDYIRAVYQIALEALVQRAPPRLPSYTDYLVVQPPKLRRPIFIDSSESEEDRPKKRRKMADCGSEGRPTGELPDLVPFPFDTPFEDIPKLCVHRASPLKCVNQDIVSRSQTELK